MQEKATCVMISSLTSTLIDVSILRQYISFASSHTLAVKHRRQER